MAITNVAAVTADLQTYFARKLLVLASKDLVFKQFGNQEPIPSNSSKTISFTQYSKLSTVSTPLTDGVTPSDTALANTAITATIDQLGAFVTLTDLAELTVKHPIMQKTLEILGMQAGESIDTAISTVLLAGTTVQYANGRANRAALTTTDVMTSTEIRKAVKTLRRNGGMPLDGGSYVLVVDPEVEADLLSDSTFVTAASYSAITKLYNGEVGTWFGVRVVRSNNLSTIASTTTVHTSILIAMNAYAVSDLQTLETFIEGPGSNSDPLHQRRTVGWKVGFKSVILNNNFMLRIESGSNYN